MQLNAEQLVNETEQEESSQGWLATFADLMSLLMCFFVLLLSFSELDVIKFQQLAGSMKLAFGVQREVIAEDIPLGTSAVLQEFSPAKPEPTLLDQVKQSSVTESPRLNDNLEASSHPQENWQPWVEQIEQQLQQELAAGQFELDQQGQQLVIRIRENGSFAAGSGYLQPQFIPGLIKLAEVVANIPGQIEVSGHTDDVPVGNELFQDNLALSAARAMAVSRVMKRHSYINQVKVSAFEDAKPLVPNINDENRAKNRRVEIAIWQGQAKEDALSITEVN